jgi:hypothetical protein
MQTSEIMGTKGGSAETEALTVQLGGLPEEERARREELLRSNPDQWDARTALERLFDRIIRARMIHYKPHALPSLRGDIPCFVCGNLYRPDDPMDAVNMFMCLTCKVDSEAEPEMDPFNYGKQQP